jgi:LmbE family N-acetylglucosaminyl deacetylase
MTDPPDRNVALTMLAHPDDMEILCGGTMLKLADLGWELHVATATGGDCGTLTETPWAIAARRTDEAAAAAEKLIATYHCLDERDGLVCYDKTTLRKAFDLFRDVAPTLVITHHPDDYMMDHVMTGQVARAASFVYGAPNITTRPLRAGSTVPHLYYADTIESVDPFGRPVEPTTLVDVTAVMDRKTVLLSCHASQREWLREHHGMDEYIEAMKRQNAHRGTQADCDYAEAFVQHRGHAYPRNDLLGELF